MHHDNGVRNEVENNVYNNEAAAATRMSCRMDGNGDNIFNFFIHQSITMPIHTAFSEAPATSKHAQKAMS